MNANRNKNEYETRISAASIFLGADVRRRRVVQAKEWMRVRGECKENRHVPRLLERKTIDIE